MLDLQQDVEQEIREFISDNFKSFLQDAEEFGSIELTIAVDANGSSWNYQTGDNSFTGGAYGLEHWAVTGIDADSDSEAVADEIINQLGDLLADC